MVGQLQSRGLLTAFGLVSLGAVLTGAWICAANGVPAAAWTRNIAAWALGALLAMGLAFTRPSALPYILGAAPAALALTFFSPALDGVHRWIDAGPLHINAAMLYMPMSAVALAGLATWPRWPWRLALFAAALLAVHPDRSQVMAWVAVAIVAAASQLKTWRAWLGLVAAPLLLVFAAWMQPDRLAPVPEVEGVIGLASNLSPWIAALAVTLLAASVVLPIMVTRKAPRRARLAGRALSLFFLVWTTAPLWGAYPVPLIGIGLSPILGAWMGVGLLAALVRADREQPLPEAARPASI